ncbi:TIGR01459 family HAD-type hydrolase [Stappia sp. ES.058]|uniref:TIGR01459 family HAD-type hydrolase n=1 Tax=Stappia sp. ES.058 TaxID=1881061 RepID=UPI00087931E9|nr:TIGR01459 family HAD-type hydrolase [Stappia sp. ES.058]SDT91520.1 HAD-superfamily class IIA hydrolase, TIGR01459 [Stappia sp. ES.058]
MSTHNPLLVPGLSALAPGYKAVLCDVWGVLHNGVSAFPKACEALQRYRAETGGKVVLITNAPRPSPPILEQLARLYVPRDAFDAVVTSGDVTRAQLQAHGDVPVMHIGPERDHSLFEGLDLTLTDEAGAGQAVCTGLVDDERETPEDYRALLERMIARDLPLLCANPDIVVERGDTLIWCAGAIARLYEDLGGRVIILGKPHAPIYEAALARVAELAGEPVAKADILAIGDGLPTDIRGAVANEIDVLFITGGIHGADFGLTGAPVESLVRKRLEEEGLRARAAIAGLVW